MRSIEAGGRTIIVVASRKMGKRAAAAAAPQAAHGAAGAALTGAEAALRAEALRDRLRRLTVHNHDPHRFHEEKDEICRDLGDLARALRPASQVQSGGAR